MDAWMLLETQELDSGQGAPPGPRKLNNVAAIALRPAQGHAHRSLPTHWKPGHVL